MGITHQKPELWFLTWIGIALIPFALKINEKKLLLALGFIFQGCIYEIAAHTWYFSIVAKATSDKYSLGMVIILAILYIMIMSIPKQLPLYLSSIYKKKVNLPVFLWFPFLFALGEYINLYFTGVSITALLYSQWKFQSILRLLNHFGWNITLVIFIMIPLVFSEMIIHRKKSYFNIFTILVLFLLFQPKINSDIPPILYETGSVYMDSSNVRPTKVPPNIKLLIWPEVAMESKPRIKEGKVENVKTRVPLKSKNAFHIIGMETKIGNGLQNSALVLDPNGNILYSRAKKMLFTGFEKPFFGIKFDYGTPFIAGNSLANLYFNDRSVVSVICFEQIYHDFIKKSIKKNTDLIVIIASDQLMGRSEEVYNQFNSIAVLLAVETGLPVVRSSREGSSVIIAPDGRILAKNNIYDKIGILSL